MSERHTVQVSDDVWKLVERWRARMMTELDQTYSMNATIDTLLLAALDNLPEYQAKAFDNH